MSALAVCVDRCRQLVHQAAGAASLGAPQAANGRYAHSAREAQQQLLEQQDGSQEPAGETLVGRAATASSSWPPGLPPPTLGPAHCQLLLGVLWPGWEDPLAQTVQRVHEAFAALLDCLEAQRCLGRAAAESSGDAGSGAGGESEFLLSLAKQLLALEPGRKGRYAPLAAVAAHLGAARLLTLRPGLVHEAVAAAADATVAHSVSGLVAVLWQRRREELHAERGRRSGGAAGDAAGDAAAAAEAEAAWRAWCLPPLIAALASPSERQRFGAATYLLPALLQEEPAMLPALLRALLDAEGAPAAGAGVGAGAGGRGAVGCLAVLKAGRRLGLVTDLGSLGPAGIAPAQLEALLRQAAAHPSEALRVDALQLICCHPRSTAPPTALELSVASRALALALRTSSGGLRSKASQALVRLLQRMRGGAALALNPASGGGAAAGAAGGGSPAALPPEVAAAEAWLRDLSGRLVLSLYPGAPYQRTYMAIQLLNLLLDTWGDCLNPVLPPCVAKDGSGRMPPGALHPFSPLLASAGAVRCLLAAALDSWDKLREAAAAVLLRLPSPLPGLESAAELRPVMAWVLALLDAPRCREADAGARLLYLLACKYVAQSGWQLSLADGTVAPPAAPPEAGQGAGDAALLATLASGCELVEARLAAARADLLGACRRGLAAGPLLALRLLAEAVPWGRLGAGAAAGAAAAEREEAAAAASEARALVARMLELCWQVAEVALPTLSRPQDENVSAEEVDAEDVPTYSDNDGEDGIAEDKEGDGAEDLGPRAQARARASRSRGGALVISTGCWISMRESCLLLGTLAQLLPITGERGRRSHRARRARDGEGCKGALLAQGQLQEMGDHLLRLLLAMKHYGAVDRAALALLALAGRLAAAPPPALAAMPRAWLAAALAFLARPGQGRSDIVRRSAGLPYALTALFEAEPEQHHRRLLAAGMHALLAVARGGGAADAGDAAALPCDGAGADAPGAAGGDPWPRVHAFNCLRMAFQSAVLAVDVSAYVAPGVEACILGLAAPQWEVRNAAMLCYTALLVRTLGFRNLAHVKDARKGLSAADFFHRFPQLHAFLLQQLRAATEQLESGGARGGGGGARVHPSLFPVLALLSRLFPSHRSRLSGSGGASGGADSANSREAFAALVQRCGAAAPAAVRRLAAEALPPLLPQEDQAAAAAGLAAAVAAAVARQQCQKRQRQQRQGQQQQGGESRTSLNALHGRLLQLRALLVAGAGGGPGGSVLLAAVAPALHEAAWACELESYPCAAVSFEYVRAAAVAADLPGALAHPEAAAWLGAVQQRCWAAIEGSVEAAAPDSANPMLSVAFKAAAQLHFSLLLRQCDAQESGASGSSSGGSGGGGEAPARRLLSQLAVALRSRRYEVRGAALKALLKHVRNWQGRRQQEQTQAQHAQQQQARVADLGLGSGGTLGELWQLLNAQLEQQGHHKAQRRLLALLALLPAAAPPDGAAGATAAGTAAASGAGLLAHLLRRAHSAADPAARRHAIECLGPQLGALLAGAGEGAAASASALEAVQQVLGAVGEASQPHQLPELRLAAVRALHASDLLRLAPLQPPGREPAASGSAADEDQWSEAAVAAWAAAVALLEDDDGGVRDAAAATVAGAAAAAEGGACAAASQQQEQQQLGWEAAGALAFELMPARFGPCPALLARLCAWCCPAAAGAQAGADAAAAAEAAAGVGASRIFDREEDNQHQEPLMVSQLAAAALAKMLASLPGSADGQSTGGAALALQPAAADLLAAWLRCALAALATLLPAAARGSGGAARPAGVGGGGSRGAARFRMLCQAWLAVWAAGHCPAALAPARPCATGSAGMSLDRERVLALIEPLAQASGREWEGQPQLAAASAAAVARWRFGGGALPADPAATFLL
eukprot:scaffold16.g62.t1